MGTEIESGTVEVRVSSAIDHEIGFARELYDLCLKLLFNKNILILLL